MFEDVKRILTTEKDRWLDSKSYYEKEVKRITEILDDFENYYKYSLEALFHEWREPTEEVTKDRLLSCLERSNNWIKTDQVKIDEIDLALKVLQEYEGKGCYGMKLSCDLSPLKGAACPYYDECTNGNTYPCEDDICPLEAVYETGDEEKMRIIRDKILQEYEGDHNDGC